MAYEIIYLVVNPLQRRTESQREKDDFGNMERKKEVNMQIYLLKCWSK